MAQEVILSPHLDDSVLSCWHLVEHSKSVVISVFAGIPSPDTDTLWDRVCGETKSAVMMHKRRKENKVALGAYPSRIINFEYLDRQYDRTLRDYNDIIDLILEQVDRGAHFYAPLAASRAWRHADHVTMRQIGKLLMVRGKKVSFYADVPYMRIPDEITNEYRTKILKRASETIGKPLKLNVHTLTKQQQAHKREAMRAYKSQFSKINFTTFGALNRSAIVEHELIFTAA